MAKSRLLLPILDYNEGEDIASYSPDAPHNKGLPSLTYYRPDPVNPATGKGRYGGKEGLETQPSAFKYSAAERRNEKSEDFIRRGVEALRATRELGYELPSEMSDPKFLTALLMKEGRPDFGANKIDTDNPESVKIFNSLVRRFGREAATFAAVAHEKGQVAKRTKLPLPLLWNGTGVQRDINTGKVIASGKNYNERFPDFLKAAEHEKNAPMVEFIRQHLNNTDYTSPLSPADEREINRKYQMRQNEAAQAALKRLDDSTLRTLQYGLFGDNKYLGVPDEYSPTKAEAAVPAPDMEKLRRRLKPEYKSGGAVENTTHDRKIL